MQNETKVETTTLMLQRDNVCNLGFFPFILKRFLFSIIFTHILSGFCFSQLFICTFQQPSVFLSAALLCGTDVQVLNCLRTPVSVILDQCLGCRHEATRLIIASPKPEWHNLKCKIITRYISSNSCKQTVKKLYSSICLKFRKRLVAIGQK